VNEIRDATNQDGTGTLVVDVETVYIKGNLDVAGTYNTVDVSASTLLVEDKKIILATSPDFDITTETDTVEDGTDTNDKAGVKIAGKPSTLALTTHGMESKQSIDDIWKKSLLWNNNDGMGYLGYHQADMTNDTSYRDKEPFWELQGGAFHLSAQKADDQGVVTTVKYGFRINPNDELEIIKKVGTAASKRVAKFGITASL